MLIDTHLHLICDEYKDINKIVNNAKRAGVDYLILGGTSMEDNFSNLKLAREYDNIFLECGIHPEFVDNYDLMVLEDLIKSNLDKVVAIGEIGLDYHYDKDNRDEQISLFRKQLDLATKYSLPVVIHSRDAYLDTINVLKEYNLKGVIHCFSGSLEVAREYVKLGYKLGIGGVVTFKNSKLKEVLKSISLNSIVLETDSPYLSPFRGRINEPKNVLEVAKFLADLYDISLEDVSKITTSNAMDLFDIYSKI